MLLPALFNREGWRRRMALDHTTGGDPEGARLRAEPYMPGGFTVTNAVWDPLIHVAEKYGGLSFAAGNLVSKQLLRSPLPCMRAHRQQPLGAHGAARPAQPPTHLLHAPPRRGAESPLPGLLSDSPCSRLAGCHDV
jgi:hypothetical protein